MFLFFYGVKVFSSGLVAFPWQEIIAKVIPVSHRGRYWGSALILGKSLGIFGAFCRFDVCKYCISFELCLHVLVGFITLYGIQRFDLPISYSAIFTGMMLISEMVGYAIWEAIGDRDGYKRVI
ncbi:hypothetical protein ACFLXI_01690 [Chloroflexota bacterium]